MRPAALSAIIFLASLLNFCDLIFHCGCHSWFTGAIARCNIHQAGLQHCPWCQIPPLPFAGGIALILIAQTAISLRATGFLPRFALALATAWTLAAIWAFSLGLATGYLKVLQ